MFRKILSKPVLPLSVVILVNENLGLLRVAPAVGKEIKNRHFARWSVRKPSKVFTSEELSSGSIDSKEFDQSEYTDNESPKEKKSSSESSNKSKYKTNKFKIASYEDEKFEYLEDGDMIFSKMMTAATNRKLRKRNDLIVLEGKRLNLDAMQAGLTPKKLFFTMPKLLKDMKLPSTSSFPLYKLAYKTTRTWSQLDTPPGVVGFYEIPKLQKVDSSDTIPVKVVCDNIRDPGNMGAIIRVAASAGCTQILLMKGCTDPWDPKVLRAASGGHFRVPISMEMNWNELKGLLQPQDVVYLADSKMVRPMPPACNLYPRLYFEASYVAPGNVVIIVGGETEGLCEDAFRTAARHNGSRVYIPLSNHMESLNSGSALSVILFEVKKQILQSGYQSPVSLTDSPTGQDEPIPSRSPELLKSAGG